MSTPTIFHMKTDIEGLLRFFKRKKMYNIITNDEGELMSDSEAREELKALLKKGHKYLASSGCSKFDPFEKGCLGHTEAELKEEKRQELLKQLEELDK